MLPSLLFAFFPFRATQAYRKAADKAITRTNNLSDEARGQHTSQAIKAMSGGYSSPIKEPRNPIICSGMVSSLLYRKPGRDSLELFPQNPAQGDFQDICPLALQNGLHQKGAFSDLPARPAGSPMPGGDPHFEIWSEHKNGPVHPLLKPPENCPRIRSNSSAFTRLSIRAKTRHRPSCGLILPLTTGAPPPSTRST